MIRFGQGSLEILSTGVQIFLISNMAADAASHPRPRYIRVVWGAREKKTRKLPWARNDMLLRLCAFSCGWRRSDRGRQTKLRHMAHNSEGVGHTLHWSMICSSRLWRRGEWIQFNSIYCLPYTLYKHITYLETVLANMNMHINNNKHW